MEALPDVGVPAGQVLAEIEALRAGDLPTHGGRLFAYVYDPGVPGLDELAAAAHALGAHVNGLNRPSSHHCWRWRTLSSPRPRDYSAVPVRMRSVA